MKRLFYALLVILFCGMSATIRYKNSFHNVLDVKAPDKIWIDLNHNQAFDKGEEKVLDYIKINPAPTDKLTDKENFIFTELAKESAKEFFFNNKIRLTPNGEILIGKLSYKNAFNNAGFNYQSNAQKYQETINYIRTNKFYILNRHNLKYHEIGCPHSTRVENYGLIEATKLPTKSEPCRSCITLQVFNTTSPSLKPIASRSFRVLFTDHTTKLKPDNQCSSGICKELLSQINNAKNSIDMAIYGYNKVPEIENALISAQIRGVKIRMVYDLNAKGESDYKDSKRLAAFIKNATSDFITEYASKYSNTIMHNKFYIFDNKTVLTGSANLSPNDMSGFNTNNTITINSETIANLYKQEFDKMYSGKFHNLKSKTLNNQGIKFDNGEISVYFSPQDKITKNHILPIIKSAKNYIDMPAFLITDKWLADELIAAKARGVNVKIILDASNAHSQYSQIKYLRSNGISVKVENYAGKIHSKSIIIDDYITITGSMNFSKSGQSANDENVLIIKNTSIAKAHKDFFDYLWNRIDNRWLTSTPRAEGFNSIGSCTDGIDNNYDGNTDTADIGCK